MRDNHRPEREVFVDIKLRHLHVIERVSINKKENRKPGSNLDLEPGPFVSYLSPLPLTSVTRRNSGKITCKYITSHPSFVTVRLIIDGSSPFHNF